MPEPTWPDEYVADDFRTAIGDHGSYGHAVIYEAALPDRPKVDRICTHDVAEVTDWFVSYHSGGRYVVGSGDTGTELELFAILRLHDGRWASVSAWNDYTGWGCQDGSNVAIGDSREQVITFGLDEEGRRKLGLEA
jgi:hypothetical protein